jgi:adenylate kinase
VPNILLLGPQGSGKGTQAQLIAQAYGIPHIATGDILRAAMADGTELGLKVKPIYDSGHLVPDELMIDIIRERLAQDDTKDGSILDGFPRTLPQAEALEGMLREIRKELDVVFVLQLPEQVAVERLTNRALVEGRKDDTPEAIAKRLELYRRETEPLIEWYRARSNVVPIHAERRIDDVFGEIQDALEQAAVA